MLQDRVPIPHPEYLKWLQGMVQLYDGLSEEDRQITFTFFRLWLSMEEARQRDWWVEETPREPHILGAG